MEEEVLYLKSDTYENRLVRIVLGVSRDRKVDMAQSTYHWEAGNTSYKYYIYTL